MDFALRASICDTRLDGRTGTDLVLVVADEPATIKFANTLKCCANLWL